MQSYLFIALLLVHSSWSATYYVSITGNDHNDGSLAHPWATPQMASAVMEAGDTTYFMNGTYTNAEDINGMISVWANGTEDAWITYAAYPGHKPVFFTAEGGFFLYNCSYIVIDGFILTGDQSETLDVNSTGVFIMLSHHVNVTNNVVSGFGSGGIDTVQADYILIEGNIVFNTSTPSYVQSSGISLYQLVNFDDNPGYHNIIRNNIGINNTNARPPQTDGECIIIDDSRNTQNDSPYGPYRGLTLIENNICAGNGGNGIEIYSSDNVHVFNNVVYQNQRDSTIDFGDMTASHAGNVIFHNNIVYSTVDKIAFYSWASTNITLGYNLFFNYDAVYNTTPTDILDQNPLFVNPSLDLATMNWHLQSGSPAIGAGVNTGLVNDMDFTGLPRPYMGRWDLGVYDWIPTTTSTSATPSMTVSSSSSHGTTAATTTTTSRAASTTSHATTTTTSHATTTTSHATTTAHTTTTTTSTTASSTTNRHTTKKA